MAYRKALIYLWASVAWICTGTFFLEDAPFRGPAWFHYGYMAVLAIIGFSFKPPILWRLWQARAAFWFVIGLGYWGVRWRRELPKGYQVVIVPLAFFGMFFIMASAVGKVGKPADRFGSTGGPPPKAEPPK